MIVFKSELFSQLMHLLKKIAPTEETTLLLGETGVGKDLLAAFDALRILFDIKKSQYPHFTSQNGIWR